MTDYTITFVPTLDRPPETMVGETVFDAEGNAIGWMNAPTEPDEAIILKLHDRMNAAMLDYESAMGIKGGNGANTVPFVIDMHQIIEDAATMGVGTCQIETTESWLPAERYHRCKRCGAFFAVLDASHDIPPRVCPNCGRRITKEEK